MSMADYEESFKEKNLEVDEIPEAVDDGKKRRKRKRKRKKADDDEENKEDDELDAAAKDADTKEREVDRTVFVEGIPYDCTREDVVAFFVQHLNATEEDADAIISDVRLPTWPDTGRLKGYGHVVFATRDLQQSACALGAKRLYLKKRYLSIAPANAPSAGQSTTQQQTLQGEPSKTIVLHNLSYDATEDDIAEAIGADANIVPGGVRVVRHNATKRSRGFAYVEFDAVEHAQEATASPIVVLGRPCRVDYDHGSIQKSFRTDTGRLWHKSYGGGPQQQKDKKRRDR
ncbi:hypothetical protein MPSEU_000983300 [Mayamaea pseudoterrestris]|nr:hypothetical protein MPSEU_000983300 [Mayamaea pseudoterrestris]